jgi:hypothetical protein
MPRDLRKKGCPNPDCEMNKKEKKYSAKENYCSRCGSELVFVCAECFCKLDDQGPQHRICAACEAKKKMRLDAVVDAGQKVAVGAEKAGVAIKKAGGKAAQNTGKAAKVGADAVKNAAQNQEVRRVVGKAAEKAADKVVDKVIKKIK